MVTIKLLAFLFVVAAVMVPVFSDDGQDGQQGRQCDNFPFWMLMQNSGNPATSGPSLWLLTAVGFGAVMMSRNLSSIIFGRR